MAKTEQTFEEKMQELEKTHEAFMAHVKEENEKYEAQRQQLRREERERQRREEQMWRDNLADEIWKGYDVGPKEVATMIVDRAWEAGHSCGYNEVRWHAEDLAEFTSKVVHLVEEMCA